METNRILKYQINDLENLCSQDNERISLIINDFLERIYYELQELNITTNLKTLIEECLNKNIKSIFLSSYNNLNTQIKELLISTKEVIDFSLENTIAKENTNEMINKTYNIKIEEINIFTDTFKELYKKNIDTFLYKITLLNNLKTKPFIYNQTVRIINNNKKDLINEYIKLINNKKIFAKNLYTKYYDSLFNKVKKEIKEIKENNKKQVIETAKNLLNEKSTTSINNNLKKTYNFINNTLEEFYKKSLKIKKLKESKANNLIFNELKEYFLSYNNTLFDKAQISIKRMNNILNYDEKTTSEKLKSYNENIYKVFNLDFNFDKPFEIYKSKILKKRSISNNQSLVDRFNDLIEEYKETITKEIKENLTTCFKETMEILNEITIKTMEIKLNLNNIDTKLNKNEILKMFKKT